MFCGEGEKVFFEYDEKITKYSIDPDGKLNLMMDDVPVMRFKHVATNEKNIKVVPICFIHVSFLSWYQRAPNLNKYNVKNK
jgi:hypothetical protein